MALAKFIAAMTNHILYLLETKNSASLELMQQCEGIEMPLRL